MRRLAVLSLLFVCALSLEAQPRTEYRAFWVDTFNTSLNNHNDVLAVVNNAKAAKANAIFAQVRRRGDSWYLNSLEPLGDRTPIQAGFDPLQDLLTEAHANGMEVHAFVIANAIWGRAPNLFPPENPNHVFNLHGGFDAATNTIIPGPNNWLTRTILPSASGVTYQGHRFGSDFWVDFGHPAAAEYTHQVLMHLVRNYDIDGLHLDRIRFPEIGITGQTPSTGTSIGYNPTSVQRFATRHNRPLTPDPAQNDALWSQWRRDQVTNFVRRLYLDAIAVKPQLKISAALIAFSNGPLNDGQWPSAEAYWRVYQDWRAWTAEGIIDIAMPMAYKREHNTEKAQFDRWNDWLSTHRYNRAGVMGLGAFLNSIEGTVLQTRRALPKNDGVIYFSMATSNVAVAPNPLSIPPGQNTPARSFAEFASGLTTGKSVNGLVTYDAAGGVFAEVANIPSFAWKTAPTVGHLMGFARREDGSVIDTGVVTITNIDTNATRSGATDGNGFFGGVDLAPGTYHVSVTLGTDVVEVCYATVVAGRVDSNDAVVDRIGPAISNLATDTAEIWPPNGRMVNVKFDFDAADNCPGAVTTEITVSSNEDDGDGVPDIEIVGDGHVRLRAERSGNGTARIYTITVKAFDDAGNTSTASTTVVVPHDQGN